MKFGVTTMVWTGNFDQSHFDLLPRIKEYGFDGVLSMECEGQGGPMIERSLAWMRATLAQIQPAGK